jgi:2,4-dienoyl-CoA reductase-like NADH-dependent reductase (Old Yellow Enzyme family)
MAEHGTPHLFRPLTQRGLTLRNRICVSPMCQYQAEDGRMTDWHYDHHVRFAMGGVAVGMVEATAVSADGRITHGCTGLWSDEQIAPLARVTAAYKRYAAIPAIQLGHAGRKASTQRPWDGAQPLTAGEGAWPTIAPSAIPVRDGWPVPKAMDEADIERVKSDFRTAARRALEAGFEVVEIHGAHGYLLHSFLSPLSNRRNDAYGGDLDGRMRLPLEVATIVREAWPAHLPVWYRVSAQDGVEGGLELDDVIELCRRLKALGIDLVDCSSGGISGSPSLSTVHPGPGFQVPFADAIRREAEIPTMAVGFITDSDQAEAILAEGKADMIAIAREHLADPAWTYHAALALGADNPHALLPHLYRWYLERRAALTKG